MPHKKGAVFFDTDHIYFPYITWRFVKQKKKQAKLHLYAFSLLSIMSRCLAYFSVAVISFSYYSNYPYPRLRSIPLLCIALYSPALYSVRQACRGGA